MRDVLGLHPSEAAKKRGIDSPLTPDQERIFESLRTHKRTAVTSGNSSGKSVTAALATLHYLYEKPDRIVVTTAGNFGQVERQIWGNIHHYAGRAAKPLAGRFLKTKIEIGPKWYAVGLSTDDYSKFTGEHAPGGVLIVIDESCGVAEEIASAALTMIPGPEDRILAIANPTDPASWFREACQNGLWNHITLDCRNHPNVIHNDPYIIPGAVTREWIEDVKAEYGEDSPAFHAKVSGQWADHAEDSLIRLSWVLAAQQRDEWPREVERGCALGLDIAGPGGDLLVLSAIVRGKWRILAWRQRHDYMQAVGLVSHWATELGASCLVWDDTGVGGALGSRFRELKRNEVLPDSLRLIPANFGARAPEKRKFRSYKDQLWWNAREVMRAGQIALPTDAELAAYSLPRGHSFIRQVTSAIYEITSEGRIDVFDRKDNHSERTKTLPSVSPDLAHSFILAAWAWKEVKAAEQEDEPTTTREIMTRAFHAGIKQRFKEQADRRKRGESDGKGEIW